MSNWILNSGEGLEWLGWVTSCHWAWWFCILSFSPCQLDQIDLAFFSRLKSTTQENKYPHEVFDLDLSDLFQIECEILKKGKNN